MSASAPPRRGASSFGLVVAWLIMVALAAVSFGVAFLDLGIWAPVIQFGVSATQTALLFLLFMRLKGPPTLRWIFAVSGFFWLLFLFGLSMTDYSNRRGWPPLYNPDGPSFHSGAARMERSRPGG